MPSKPTKRKHSLRLHTLLAALALLVVIPGTILGGVFYLGDRKYYFVSLLLILYSLLPFLVCFERRQPKPREIVLVAVLAAIAAAGRAAFFMLPQFKPLIAIVIISGVCFGAETGFLVGVTAVFVSNFFFGQGPWTPWQMFCCGIIGLGAGVLFAEGTLKKNRLLLCLYGGFSTFFIYGTLMDVGALLMFTPQFSRAAFLTVYISGFWFNIIHSAATVLFLYLLSPAMIKKLERIKRKYGLLAPPPCQLNTDQVE
jgi:energy-coupling factor transport system substrate-specific component